MIRLIPALRFAAAVTPPATVQSETAQLYDACKAAVRVFDGTDRPGIDVNIAPYCLGFARGFLAEADGVCMPESTFNTIARVYVTYMDQHPRLRDEPGGVGFGLALRASYPCPAQKP